MKKLFLLLLALILLLTAACQKPHPSNEPDTTSPEGTLDSDPDNPGNLSDSNSSYGGDGYREHLYSYYDYEYEDYLEFLASEVSPEWLVSYDMISDFGSFDLFLVEDEKNFEYYRYFVENAEGNSIQISFVKKNTERYRKEVQRMNPKQSVENAQDMRLHSKDGCVEHEGIYYHYVWEGQLYNILWETNDWLISINLCDTLKINVAYKIDESPLGKLLSLETAPEAVAQINAAIAPALAKTPAAE